MREYTDANSVTYRILDMEPFPALHVSRKLLPLLAGFSGLASLRDNVLAALEPPVGADQSPAAAQALTWAKVDVLAKSLQPLFESLSDMTEKDSEFVIRTCLSYVLRVEENKAVAVWNKSANRFQYALKLPEILTLTGLSIMENAGDFFPGKA